MKLVSNGFEYKVTKETDYLYYSESPHKLARRATKEKYTNIIEQTIIEGELDLEADGKYFFFSFSPLEGLEKKVKVNINRTGQIRREYVKWKIYEQIKEKYLVDFTRFGSDITIYKKNQGNNFPDWDSYSTYNIIIRDWQIHLSIGSRETLISKGTVPNFVFNGLPVFKAIENGHIYHKETLEEQVAYNVLASQDVRIHEKLISKPMPPNYSQYYKEILTLYQSLIEIPFDGIVLLKNGFKYLEPDQDYFPVAKNYNIMQFKGGHTNVNASNGIKIAGPCEPPNIDLKNLEFFFVYPNSERMKELFLYLRNGKTAYYPGLERYVDIPMRKPSEQAVLKYEYSDYVTLPQIVNTRIEVLKQSFPDKIFFAIVLLPKSKRDSEGNEVEYYELKRIFIENKIPSQFIDERGISTNNFVYSLPNISIAIHAKIGGVPWKLHSPDEKELIIGFGDATESNQHYIGSTVFFDNTGKLKSNNFFQHSNLEAFKLGLKESIMKYLEENSEKPERLILHYYKIPGAKEKDVVLKALKEFGIDIPYVIVTINDTKAKDFIAFDLDHGFGMPMSGLAWRIKKNEYILFNNNRYEQWPRSGKVIKQEYPIKLQVWFSNEHHNTSKNIQRIIGQVFEFSRMYWKSIHQQSKPVTATYPEMIASYGCHFQNNDIPKNWVTQTTPWFI